MNRKKHHMKSHKHAVSRANALTRTRGIIAMEFVLVLPILIFLSFAVVDFSRAIQAQMILVNLSREGANLASRGSLPLQTSSQNIINSLAATTPPLSMKERGMVYITKIMGNKDSGGVIRNVVLEQYRWDDRINGLGFSQNHYLPPSRVWNCSNWGSDGSCQGIPAPNLAPVVTLMNGTLTDGEVIYAVESFYNFDTYFTNMSFGSGVLTAIGPDLSSIAIF